MRQMSEQYLLTIENLAVEVDGREILHDVNLSIGAGETHALFGPNGSGKTTLLMAIMGFPRYKVVRGRIAFRGQDIRGLSLDERARLGIGMSFQRVPVVRGVRMRDVIISSTKGVLDDAAIEEMSERLNVNDLLDRELNHGFSGGEIKRSELMQLLAQGPDLVLLDEPESGVDIVNIAIVGQMINELLRGSPRQERIRSGLIITHTGGILDYVPAGKGYVMVDGRVISDGEASEVLKCIREKGFEECSTCQK